MPDTSQYKIQALDAAMSIIECMASGTNQYQGASEIAHCLGMNRSRVFRILKTLEDNSWVEFDPQTQNYRLGWRFLSVADHIRERLDVRREATDTLIELAQTTGDSAQLMVLYGDHAVCVERFKGEHAAQIPDTMGQPIPLHVGAAPKVLLANLSSTERRRVIENTELTPYTSNSITDKEVLRLVLESIRRNGYAFDEQDYEHGVYAIGAPVYDHSGQVVAAISVTLPEARFDAERKQMLIERVTQAAQKISVRLGHRPI